MSKMIIKLDPLMYNHEIYKPIQGINILFVRDIIFRELW